MPRKRPSLSEAHQLSRAPCVHGKDSRYGALKANPPWFEFGALEPVKFSEKGLNVGNDNAPGNRALRVDLTYSRRTCVAYLRVAAAAGGLTTFRSRQLFEADKVNHKGCTP